MTSYSVRLDGRRRPTLPLALLEEAGIATGPHELIARVEGPGRVVLEDPTALLAALQKTVAASKLELSYLGTVLETPVFRSRGPGVFLFFEKDYIRPNVII